ncbi:MAG: hypothetical protein AABW48_02310 [Nanoarchaeota archaeon]
MSNRYSRVLPASAVSSLVDNNKLTSLETNVAAAKEKPINAPNISLKENKPGEDKNETKEIALPDLEMSVKDQVTKIDQLDIRYSLEKQFLAEQFYKPQDRNYHSFVSGNAIKPAFAYESDNKSVPVVSDNDSEMLTVKEAEELFTESQSASIVGAAHDVSAAKRRKLDYFAKFEPAYFGLFMAQALTREVNFNSY